MAVLFTVNTEALFSAVRFHIFNKYKIKMWSCSCDKFWPEPNEVILLFYAAFCLSCGFYCLISFYIFNAFILKTVVFFQFYFNSFISYWHLP